MRQFYYCFPIQHSVNAELSWTHYKHIITVKNSLARDYYINEAVSRQLSVRKLERLSIELTKEYGGAFNKSSLWRMIQFYECFPIVASVKRELSWTHYRYIMRVDSLEARAKYGDRLIERLSIELISRYGSGFTKSNLKRMRQFYEYFPISHSLSDQLSWTHYKYIITVKNSLARDYYIGE